MRKERNLVDFDPAMYATETDEMPVKVFYTEDEITKMKDRHFENSTKLAYAEEEKKQLLAVKNEEIKMIKREIEKDMAAVTKGYREEVKEVYLVPNYDEGRMEYITSDREVVKSRKLRADEMQENVIRLVAAN
ncbi:hypothetical protein J6Z39_09055 [bacterium]|nr:hypothetical protein [bacterium]MBP5435951.1 hypothetical protein [bacterium]